LGMIFRERRLPVVPDHALPVRPPAAAVRLPV
jgi:hypothetical protein